MFGRQLHNSQSNQILDTPSIDTILATGQPYQTGTLSHQLGLRSVYELQYQHQPNSQTRKPARTVTTFHDAWLMVDYILYSRPFCAHRRRHVEGAVLRLLGRWRLPSVGECERQLGRIPNAQHGSDHVSLAARFRVGISWFEADAQDK